MRIVFAELPYAKDALEPHYSAKTIGLHYGKHHRAYYDKTVELIRGTPFEEMELEDLVQAAKDRKQTKLFNNAAQIWNHDLFWRSMKPEGGGKPGGALARLIERDFGDYAKLREQLHDAAVEQFGSGWAWLTVENEMLSIMATSNAETPLTSGVTALLAIDVWEHAYYPDYQNRRPDYVDTFLDRLANWHFAEERLKGAVDVAALKTASRKRA